MAQPLSTGELTIAGNVRAELARAAFTGPAVRAALGVSADSLSRRMRGETAWRPVELERVAQLIGVSTSVLTSLPASTPTE